jgi:hypothetical protein
MNCFVIMPFGDIIRDPDRARRFDRIYSQWIKPTVEGVRLVGADGQITCHRADRADGPGEIITHIIEHLVAADIVIADLSGRNPNVFYELGVRHAVNNNTILIAEDLNDVPFDLRGLRTISYSYEPEQMLNLRSALEKAIMAILADPGKIDNPIRRYLYEIEVNKLIRQTTPPGYDSLMQILSEVVSLKKELNAHQQDVRRFAEIVTKGEPTDGSSADPQVARFEGMWRSNRTNSIYCARFLGGELRVAYCWDSDSHLTGHYYNCRLLGDTLFGRFEWFNRDVMGYVFLRVVDDDHLSGGWWYREDVPEDARINDVVKLNRSLPGMYESEWTRIKERREFPKWADEYFRKFSADSRWVWARR